MQWSIISRRYWQCKMVAASQRGRGARQSVIYDQFVSVAFTVYFVCINFVELRLNTYKYAIIITITHNYTFGSAVVAM